MIGTSKERAHLEAGYNTPPCEQQPRQQKWTIPGLAMTLWAQYGLWGCHGSSDTLLIWVVLLHDFAIFCPWNDPLWSSPLLDARANDQGRSRSAMVGHSGGGC